MTKNYEFAHNLARKGTPNLFMAANFLEPDDKYRAFLAAYSAMKLADDIVDNSRAVGDITGPKRREITRAINRFETMFENRQIADSMPHSLDIKLALARFEIPSWPFIELAEAMKFDITNDRFDTFEQFLTYAEGAAVAPASVFMHLAACSFDERGQLRLPSFDIREASRPIAIFSYLVHILRDFKEDYISGEKPLLYIDIETTDLFHICEHEIAETASGWQQSPKFTKMIMCCFSRLTEYQIEAEKMIETISDRLPEDGLFAVRFVFELYSATAAKIPKQQYILVRNDLNLTNSEILDAAVRAGKGLTLPLEPILDRLNTLIASEAISA